MAVICGIEVFLDLEVHDCREGIKGVRVDRVAILGYSKVTHTH